MFATELQRLTPLVEAGLVEIDSTGLTVTETGWYLVRAIAMSFDAYLQTDLDRARFSKII
jgi:oxygen-independent coproporphyrinogen-3 oxidase